MKKAESFNDAIADIRHGLPTSTSNPWSGVNTPSNWPSLDETEIQKQLVDQDRDLQRKRREAQEDLNARKNEELQSVNEELHTLNTEYQAKIAELIRLNDDVANLLRSARIGIVFLDPDLRITRFTPAIGELMPLLERDEALVKRAREP